jgi:hypothetical protein
VLTVKTTFVVPDITVVCPVIAASDMSGTVTTPTNVTDDPDIVDCGGPSCGDVDARGMPIKEAIAEAMEPASEAR